MSIDPHKHEPLPVYAETQKRIGYGDILLVREGDFALVQVLYEERWVTVIREHVDGQFSHGVTSLGIESAIKEAIRDEGK